MTEAEKNAERNLVLKSIETPGGGRCVDLFQRPAGSFGFEEFRRDAEDGAGEGRGWYPIGTHAGGRYPCEEAALAAAREAVPWLAGVMESLLEAVMESNAPPDTT